MTVNVRYDATFTPFERQLAGLGLNYHSHVTLHGIDGATVGAAIPEADFPHQNFAVTVGNTDQIFHQEETETVARVFLQEDAGADTDEFKCKIRLHSQLIPPEFTPDVFTDQEVMLG